MSILQTERINSIEKAMKLFAVLFTALFVLLGCAKEESTAFELKNDQQTSTITYYTPPPKGDVVTSKLLK